MKKKCYVIENNSQRVLEFESIAEMKRWAKERGWKVKRSPLSDDCYYIDSYEILPTEEID